MTDVLPQNPVPSAVQQDFADVLGKLQPRGRIWDNGPGSLMAQLRVGQTALMAQFSAQLSLLTESESYPPTSDLLLPAWEEVFGLPDPCTPLNPTIAQRQQALAARLAATGGLSKSTFEAIALAYGFGISITEFRPFQVGVSAVGDALASNAWVFTWQVNVLWSGEPGNPAVEADGATLECVFRRYCPPEATVIFNYG